MSPRPSANPGLPQNHILESTSSEVSVRPARLDRPLRRSALEPTYADPHLEDLVRAAAQRARQQAQAEGYASGWSQGRQAAGEKAQIEVAQLAQQLDGERAVITEHVRELLAELGAAARAARVTVLPEWTEVADVLAEGSLRLATSMLGRELQTVDDALAHSVRMALRMLADPGQAVVHLNPADAEMAPDDETLGIRVVSDPEVALGSVLVLTPSQRLLHDLPAALAAAEEVLRS